MKKRILPTIAVGLWMSAGITAQNVMLIEYNNGNSRLEQTGDIKEITFVNSEEIADNTPNDISRGLEAYYTFDTKTANDSRGAYHAQQNGGTFILDTPSGSGYALNLRAGEFMTIGSAPLDAKENYSVSLWVKDFSSGAILQTPNGRYDWQPSLRMTEDMRLQFCTGNSNYSGQTITFAADMAHYQSGQWVMLTIVSEPSGNGTGSTLYVNGRRADSGTSSDYDKGGGLLTKIGGATTAMKIDNIRLYSVTLTDDEVADIYQRELQKAHISLSTTALTFDKETDTLRFSISNHSQKLVEYSITDNLGIVRSQPSFGHIPAKGSQEVTVAIDERSQLAQFTKGVLTVKSENGGQAIDVEIARGKDAPAEDIAVRRGLTAYYPFDDETAADAMPYGYDGVCNGGRFTTDTPGAEGKALLLRKGESVTVGSAPLDGRKNYSLSLWVKDFGTGPLIWTPWNTRYQKAPSLFVNENLTLSFCTGNNNYSGQSFNFLTDLSKLQSGQWVMLTVVCEPMRNNTNYTMCTLYINGRRADCASGYNSDASGATSMTIGGGDPMLIDNVRLYGVTLTDDEVAEIYASEQ